MKKYGIILLLAFYQINSLLTIIVPSNVVKIHNTYGKEVVPDYILGNNKIWYVNLGGRNE